MVAMLLLLLLAVLLVVVAGLLWFGNFAYLSLMLAFHKPMQEHDAAAPRLI